jgi:hypothetical protein
MNTIIKQKNVFHTMWTEELESGSVSKIRFATLRGEPVIRPGEKT